jgi:hypothetical protein
VAGAGAAEVGDRGRTVERDGDEVIEHHLPGRAADATGVERVLAAVAVAEADFALDRGGDVRAARGRGRGGVDSAEGDLAATAWPRRSGPEGESG